MMMLSMTLRRKTDPKTGKHTLCEPAQSKCTWTCHKRHFVQKIPGKMPDANPAASILCDPTQSKCTWTCHKRHFVRKFFRENAGRASLCSRNAHGHVTTGIMCGNLQGTCQTLFLRPQPFCASVRSRNAHRHVTRGILMTHPRKKIFQEPMCIDSDSLVFENDSFFWFHGNYLFF